VETVAVMNDVAPLLPGLVNDPESIIRQHLAMQFLPLSVGCVSTNNTLSAPKKGYQLVTKMFLPLLAILLSDVDPDVRKAASDTIASLASYIEAEDVNRFILHIPITLSQERDKGPESEDRRVTAAILIGELSPNLSPDLVCEFVSPALKLLSQDESFRVRKSAAQAIPYAISSTTFEDVVGTLLPLFMTLSKDEMYRVRKTCAECMVDMSRGLASDREGKEILMEFRRNELIKLVVDLLEDANKIVNQGMLQFLGPFIASFFPLSSTQTKSLPYFPHSRNILTREQKPVQNSDKMDSVFIKSILSRQATNPPHIDDIKAVNNQLLSYFITMSTISTGDANTDAEMKVHCAYSLPAVLLLLGNSSWSTLRECFFHLATNQDTPPILAVKRCLASSLHVMSHILSIQITEEDILPILAPAFLRSTDQITRTNTFKHLSSLMSILSPAKRLMIMSVINDILMSSQHSTHNLNWRLRHVLAKQLPSLLQIFTPIQIQENLTTLIFHFLQDPVSAVREDTYPAIPILFVAFCRDLDHDWTQKSSRQLVRQLQTILVQNQDFSRRMAYCRVCSEIGLALKEMRGLEHNERSTLEDALLHLLPLALQMKDDRVTNVRLTLRKSLSTLPSTVPGVDDTIRDLDEEAQTWEFTGGWDKEFKKVVSSYEGPTVNVERNKAPEEEDTVEVASLSSI